MIRKVASSLLLMLFILCSAISIMRAANVQKCWQDSVSTILAPHTEEELSALEVSYPEGDGPPFSRQNRSSSRAGLKAAGTARCPCFCSTECLTALPIFR